MDNDGPSTRPRKRGRWIAFLIGMLFGAALAALLPRYAGPYIGNALAPSTVVEGDVTEKQMQAERVILKIKTPDGVLLASFTENRDDVDLLVEPGDSIRLGANRYQPFLANPTILAVREPAAETRDEATSAREAYLEGMKSQLSQLEAKLTDLEAIAARASGDAAKKYDAELETLREKREIVRKKLAELETTSSTAWKDLKSGLDTAWAELKESLEAAASRFRDPEQSSE